MSSPTKSCSRDETELACPYFMPLAKLENGCWPHPGRLPLGCGWSGHCTAPGHEGASPSQDVLEAFCNLGYASGCAWAPSERNCDALRFAVLLPPELSGRANRLSPIGGGSTRNLRLRYVRERDHRPVDQGELEFDISREVWLQPHPDPRIQKMAECFLGSYLKKKS